MNKLVSVHLSYILGGLPFEERFSAARKPGFNAVEFPFPYSVPAPEYLRMLAENGLVQVSIGAPTSDYKSGMPGCSIFDGVPLAAELGLRQTNAVD